MTVLEQNFFEAGFRFFQTAIKAINEHNEIQKETLQTLKEIKESLNKQK